MDIVTPSQRSALMANIRGKDTRPEMRVRHVVWGLGYRYRLHRRDLPGKPDLVFPKFRKVILVHGCFWHRHEGCRFCYSPKTNIEFWMRKFAANQERDQRNLILLRDLGWDALVIWECETSDSAILRKRITHYLGADLGNEDNGRD